MGWGTGASRGDRPARREACSVPVEGADAQLESHVAQCDGQCPVLHRDSGRPHGPRQEHKRGRKHSKQEAVNSGAADQREGGKFYKRRIK